MNTQIKSLLIIAVLFILIDIPFITRFNNDMYLQQFIRINNYKIVQNTILPTIFAYSCLIFGIYHFVVLNNLNKSLTYIAKQGALFGFITYGIYNSTNKATIAEFGIYEAITDTIWGTILCALIPVLTIHFLKYLT